MIGLSKRVWQSWIYGCLFYVHSFLSTMTWNVLFGSVLFIPSPHIHQFSVLFRVLVRKDCICAVTQLFAMTDGLLAGYASQRAPVFAELFHSVLHAWQRLRESGHTSYDRDRGRVQTFHTLQRDAPFSQTQWNMAQLQRVHWACLKIKTSLKVCAV